MAAAKALIAWLFCLGLAGLPQLSMAQASKAQSASAPAQPGPPLTVRSALLDLNPEQPGLSHLGSLTYLGGLVLASDDERFGGYSGLVVDADGRGLWAISDLGHWLRLDFALDGRGVPAAIRQARILPLRDAKGRQLERKHDADAESLRRSADGHWLVGFEHWHRVWVYDEPGGPAMMALPLPPAATDQPANGGVEAMAALPQDGLLLFSENLELADADGKLAGAAWLRRNGCWEERRWPKSGDFRPTDATALPNGDVVVLERYFTVLVGPKARLRLIPAAAVNEARLEATTLAEWARPVSIDNMEALDARRAADGSAWLYVMSDDNRNGLQRTLLMVFRLGP
ncbi:MAG TPA: esterase-like activity of phytase family protein [Ferrovibrio sp.]|uniref:esterase-like activity of phytase family protein n=1 Tax=Ferrovibrio sp. TaxID=1917215 RepID=UPI002ED3BA4C